MTSNEISKPIVSVHIPKTAGTSISQFWQELFGKPQVFEYSVVSEGFHKASDGKLRNNLYAIRNFVLSHNLHRLYRLGVSVSHKFKKKNKTDDLPSNLKVVHGHFSPSKILGVLGKQLDDVYLTTVIREPLERTLSSFFYLQKLVSVKYPILPPWYEPGIEFEDFALLENSINYQAKLLDGFSFTDFHYLGTVDRLDQYCRHFDPDGICKIPYTNRSQRHGLELSSDFIRKFSETHRADYELYSYAAEFSKNAAAGAIKFNRSRK